MAEGYVQTENVATWSRRGERDRLPEHRCLATQPSDRSIATVAVAQATAQTLRTKVFGSCSSCRTTEKTWDQEEGTTRRIELHPSDHAAAALINVRLVCGSKNGCHGWVLLKGRKEALVAVHYVEMREGSTLVSVAPHLRAGKRNSCSKNCVTTCETAVLAGWLSSRHQADAV
jgi:hypothetical protein